MSDLSPIQHRYVQANGLRFQVATCGEGERLALFLHGFPESSYSWRHQMPVLTELGYRCWAPDLRGYGGTTRPPHVGDYSLEALMEDVAALIDASGATSTLLVAHDWGAIIAWYFAMRRKRPLQRLVIMNVPHPGVMEKVIRQPRQLMRSWYAFLFQIPKLPEWLLSRDGCRPIGEAFRASAIDKSRFPEDVLRVYRENARQRGALTAMLNYYRALVRGGGGLRQRRLGYPTITTPTLMIWGEEDIALRKETTYGTDAYVENLTLRYLPNVSHWVQQEAPEQVNAILVSWLRGQPLLD